MVEGLHRRDFRFRTAVTPTREACIPVGVQRNARQ